MRWWMWVAAAVGVVAIVALAAAWVALTTARADLERQDDRLDSLERQPDSPAVIGDRLAALEGQVARLAEVQGQIADALDRIEALENQTPPAAPSLAPVLNRLDALEGQIARLAEVQGQIADALDRIEALENQAPPTAPSLAPILDRVEALDGRTGGLEQEASRITSALDSLAALADELAALAQRIEALEGTVEFLENSRAAASSLSTELTRARIRIQALEDQGTATSAALTPILDGLTALAAQVADLERSSGQHFLVADTYRGDDWDPGPGILGWRFCIAYTVPGGLRDKCIPIVLDEVGNDRFRVREGNDQLFADCFYSARIGDPLPDCWR